MSRLDSDQMQAPRDSACDGALRYESVLVIRAKSLPEVTFSIYRASFGRRMELSRRVLELTRKTEFLNAGTELDEKVQASILAQEIDAMYLHWGLVGIEGLLIDGQPATVEQLIERGPEELAKEAVAAIKEQCGLNDAERKN